MPTIFRLPKIKYWQGFSFLLVVSILSSILFNGGLIYLNQTPSSTASSIRDDISSLRKDISLMTQQVDAIERQLKTLNEQLQQGSPNL